MLVFICQKFLLWVREGKLGESFFLHLLILSCLQLKIIPTPQWYVWRWYTLLSYMILTCTLFYTFEICPNLKHCKTQKFCLIFSKIITQI